MLKIRAKPIRSTQYPVMHSQRRFIALFDHHTLRAPAVETDRVMFGQSQMRRFSMSTYPRRASAICPLVCCATYSDRSNTMKNGRHPTRFVPILCVFAAIAICLAYSCNEENGEGDSKIPVIINIQIVKKSAANDPIDPSSSGDPIEVYMAEELTPSFSSTYRIHQVDIDDSYRHPDPGFFGGDPGVWRLEFELTDECRHLSDEYAIWVNALRP